MKKILLVDDSRAIRLVGRRITETIGLTAIEAENGQAGLEMLHQHPDVDVVLLDWNMPVLDGIGFLKALRSEERESQPVVVMCTTENDMSRIVQAMESGANEYIMKPFTEEIVRDKLQEVGVL